MIQRTRDFSRTSRQQQQQQKREKEEKEKEKKKRDPNPYSGVQHATPQISGTLVNWAEAPIPQTPHWSHIKGKSFWIKINK